MYAAQRGMAHLKVSSSILKYKESPLITQLVTLCNVIPITLILLTWRIWWAPNNASRWQM